MITAKEKKLIEKPFETVLEEIEAEDSLYDADRDGRVELIDRDKVLTALKEGLKELERRKFKQIEHGNTETLETNYFPPYDGKPEGEDFDYTVETEVVAWQNIERFIGKLKKEQP